MLATRKEAKVVYRGVKRHSDEAKRIRQEAEGVRTKKRRETVGTRRE